MFVRQNKKQKVRSSTSNSNEFRRSTPWKDSQLQPLSLERLDDSEDVATRPPNSPLTPERELAPQQTPQPTTEAAAPNPGASQGEVDADRRPTPAFGILSLQSRDQAAGKMMDHPAMQDSPPVTSDISSGPFLAKGHPLYSIGGRFVNVEHVLAGDETSAVSEAETPSILHEAHGRAEGKLMTVLV